MVIEKKSLEHILREEVRADTLVRRTIRTIRRAALAYGLAITLAAGGVLWYEGTSRHPTYSSPQPEPTERAVPIKTAAALPTPMQEKRQPQRLQLPQHASGIYYIVSPGESVSLISREYTGHSQCWRSFLDEDGGDNAAIREHPDLIRANDTIFIPYRYLLPAYQKGLEKR